jgi:hypothetical protein
MVPLLNPARINTVGHHGLAAAACCIWLPRPGTIGSWPRPQRTRRAAGPGRNGAGCSSDCRRCWGWSPSLDGGPVRSAKRRPAPRRAFSCAAGYHAGMDESPCRGRLAGHVWSFYELFEAVLGG